MQEEKNKVEATDFAPDLSVSEENLIDEELIKKEMSKKDKPVKTSVNFDKDTSIRLQHMKEQGINVSHYVNKVVSDNIRLENELLGNIYGNRANDFVKTEVLLHKDVAILFKLLKDYCGAIPLANKIAEVIMNDNEIQGQLLRGDCSVYGKETLENALDTIRRNTKRIQEKI